MRERIKDGKTASCHSERSKDDLRPLGKIVSDCQEELCKSLEALFSEADQRLKGLSDEERLEVEWGAYGHLKMAVEALRALFYKLQETVDYIDEKNFSERNKNKRRQQMLERP